MIQILSAFLLVVAIDGQPVPKLFSPFVTGRPFLDLGSMSRERQGPPIVIVPGIQCSNLDIFVDKKKADMKKAARCPYMMAEGFVEFWVNPTYLGIGMMDCFEYGIRLQYDNYTGKTVNNPGVTIRPANDFGDPTAIEYFLHPFKGIPYMAPLINYFVYHGGYEKGKSILGGQYDWRKAPNENRKYFKQLRKLIEDTYRKNDREKVVILGQSMGGLFAVYFLNQQKQKWKDKYIRRYVTLSAPYGGAVTSLEAFTKGLGPVFFPYEMEVIRRVEKSFPTLVYLLPNRYGFSKKRVLIETAHKNVTRKNMIRFLSNVAQTPHLKEIYSDLEETIDFGHPGVNISCLYNYGRRTPSNLIFKTLDDIPLNPVIEYGDGDGIVNLSSLEYCMAWGLNSDYDFEVESVKMDIDHTIFVTDRLAIQKIYDMIVKKPK